MTYTEITLNEMKQLLNGWTEVLGSTSTHEYVYEKMINENPKIVIKVYTSISKNNDNSRDKGQDAIRVCAVELTHRIGWIKTIRVLRVAGWRNNLNKAISSVIFESNKRLVREHLAPVKVHFVSQEKTVPTPKKLFHPCWTVCKDKKYVTEASDLDANSSKYRRDICPHCGGQFSTANLTETKKNDDHELLYWEFDCPHCHSNLTVLND